ncbi:PadR family transcriptional regulator [Thermostaphylospora chromogena]|uniref:DNA-binding transcriptional regulator, PadR family n=1 Tax=Thermostaphylospora chromogena TaxID=35622 RepID=A0A1H1HT43_9ACTN|nr:PadR family transcriptional regulator [Thermostaphylospora chromogena]SDR28681.1 DNA-binding transcriptional regulator, PadR family [Thermostaphylospora chromogena]
MPHRNRTDPFGAPHDPASRLMAGLLFGAAHGPAPFPPPGPPRPPHGPPPLTPPGPAAMHPPLAPPDPAVLYSSFAPRIRRGAVRAAVLSLLSEEPRNGYQIIQEIAERSGGIWRPSPGSVYPALQQLEDERLVVAEESGGSRTYRLTDEGRAYVAEHAEKLAALWTRVTNSLPKEMAELRLLWAQLNEAFGQLVQVANARQVAAARRLLRDTRRSIFRILAEDDLEEADDE